MRRNSLGRFKLTARQLESLRAESNSRAVRWLLPAKDRVVVVEASPPRRRVAPGKPGPQFPRSTAYHEAGHAVARIYFGAPATATRVFRDGAGYSEGGVVDWSSTNPGNGGLWDLLLMSMAGIHAEARATKRPIPILVYTSGIKDYATAACIVDELAARLKMSPKKIWAQTDRERRLYLRRCWRTIEIVAARLQKSGYVSKRMLKEITRNYRRVLDPELMRSASRPNGARAIKRR